jgi:hypothetical protein
VPRHELVIAQAEQLALGLVPIAAPSAGLALMRGKLSEPPHSSLDLPPVGIITMRDRVRTPACEQLIDCLRRAAKVA